LKSITIANHKYRQIIRICGTFLESYKDGRGEYHLEACVVTCYFRHLKEIFKKAGINVTSENRKEIDKIIHNIVHVDYKDCPAVWREVRRQLAKDEEDFVSKLREAWNKRA
jgi:hypothetical protein